MTCTKIQYLTPVDAMLALIRIYGQRDTDRLEKHERRWYRCGECDLYHLTSMEIDVEEQITQRAVRELGIAESDIKGVDLKNRLIKLYNWRRVEFPEAWL